MKKTLLIFFTFLSISCFAQFSKTHYIPPLSGSDQIAAQDQFLYISTPSITPVKVKINAIGVGITEIIVSKNLPVEYSIGFGTGTQLHVNPTLLNTPLSNKGYIIEAESLIYVAARVLAGNYNQAGSLVSKGISAIGNEFRVGAFINTGSTNSATFRYTFLSILATENNTVVDFSGIKAGVTLVGNTSVGNNPPSVTLNRGQSYVLATEDISTANKDGLIGALVKSNKPIVMNCGSYGGTNGDINGNLDLGFDQIVPAKIIGNEYIFVRGFGLDITERPLLVVHEDNTDIYINGSSTPLNLTPLNAGQYAILDGTNYSANGSLYVRTTKNVFAYQSVGGVGNNGMPSQANQEMFFVPPLNCSTPNIVDNIPYIERIGSRTFTTNSGLNIVTEKGATVEISINGVRQPVGVLPQDIVGKPDFVSYTITNLTGHIGVFSSKQVYVSYFGSSGAATYGGYYSGFDTKPEIVSDKISLSNSTCIPNVILNVSSISSYDTFEWFFNNSAMPNSNSSTYTPTQPGYYQVKGSISGCSSPPVLSDLIPVSICPTDIDNDKVYDNIDLDNDQDGITNCTESYGNQEINISNQNAGNIVAGTYSNSFTGTVTTSTTASVIPFAGSIDGSFISEVPAGKTNFVTYTINFAKPISLGMEYVNSATATNLLNSEAEYTVNSDVNKTITVLNPDNQLLIDTNYDGIYESGITQFSSFEIRFRLNSATPLPAGTGTFKFLTYLTNSIIFTHKNLSDTNTNKSTLKFFAVCVPKDSDGDGTTDDIDTDSDNDGIPDTIESQKNDLVIISNSDTNNNGLDTNFEPGSTPIDTDGDLIQDYLDLDSDNDGILDSVETGIDTDADGIRNFRDLDSDNDLCNDVIEAGFTDGDGDGLLGNNLLTVNTKGIVISGTNGYTVPNSNYITAGLIIITSQPQNKSQCILQNVSFTIASNADTFRWQVSTDGISWNNIVNNSIYSNVNTNSLVISGTTASMNGYQYRVNLNKTGNSCGLTSSSATLTTLALPVVANSIILKQCDNDTDGISDFNLTEKNSFISTNYTNEVFSYFTTLNGANTNDTALKIGTPTAYSSGTGTVWARVENSNGCFSTSKINLIVSATQINATFHKNFTICDDYVDASNDDKDGIASFNFSSVTANIQAILPSPSSAYSIKYYKNEADALAETYEIANTTTYRNIGFQNQQQIWVRVDSNLDNACFGLGNYVTLTVEKLPVAHAIPNYKECDEISNDGIFTFNTSTLQSNLLSGQSNVTVTYFDQNNNPLPSPFPNSFATSSQIIKARVTNNTTNTNNALPCYDETSITFIVDKHPVANPVVILPACDDTAPSDTDGLNKFDTSSIESTILNGQVGMVVKYFDSNGNPLPSPLPNPFNTATQNVKATVENPFNTTCTEETILQFVVNPLPRINLNSNGNEDELVCSNQPTFFVKLNAGIQDGSPTSNFTYVWSKDNTVLIGESGPTLDVNAEGNYTVEVNTLLGCSRTRKIKVTASDIAHLDTIKIIDLTDINSITVNVTGQGQYEYSLDEPYGPFQVSALFENVPSGIHEVYINDKNGCGIISQTVAVLGVPKYFTPNGDGYNDFWSVKGVNANFNTNSIIFIYDRYGKLITKIKTNGEGWDGTFNGNPLPADDYWYTAKLEDGREAKGHFSLNR